MAPISKLSGLSLSRYLTPVRTDWSNSRLILSLLSADSNVCKQNSGYSMDNGNQSEVDDVALPDSTCNFKPQKYKVVIVGDGGTGKSSYVSRLHSENFRHEYIATLGVEKTEIIVNTTHGDSTIELWDTAGQEKLGPLRDSYYEDADAAIIFCDVTSRITYKNVPNWHRDIERVRKDIPCVLCANKIDVKERKVKSKSILYPSKCKMGFFEISVLERISLKEPLEYLLQQLIKEPELRLKTSLDASVVCDVSNINI